ncbi:MAG: glutamate 5-kinase [Acidimicrobiia bacterium]
MTGRRPLAPGGRVVVKVGSSSVAMPEGGLDREALARVVAQVAGAWDRGNPTVLVSSGAVAAGMPALGLDRRPTDLPGLQVAAAVGQSRLMERYTTEFSTRGLVAGQVLLTKDVLAHREQYLHARAALGRMLGSRIVPVVNENDTVGVEELRLGDNDRLAAVVSHLVGAQLLLILTDTAGIFSIEQGQRLLSAVRHTARVLDRLSESGVGPLGSGGVATKVAAARMAAWSGIPTVVAWSAEPEVVARVLAGEEVGTWVEPEATRLSSRRLWIAFGQSSAGRVTVDAGAVEALVRRGRSLLPVGVVAVEGAFSEGTAVEVLGPDGEVIAKGLAAMSSEVVRRAMGSRSGGEGPEEFIHRDDLVILATP